MAQNLQLLKRRIKTAKNISQIAKAMEMISASKIKRAQTAVENNKPYAQRVTRLTTKLIKNLGGSKFHHPFIENRTDSPRKLLIALSPDKGLCGSLNTNLFKKMFELNSKETDLVTIGVKISRFATRLDTNLIASFPIGTSLPSYSKVFDLLEFINQYYVTGKVSQVDIMYSEFKSFFLQTPVVHTLLPIHKARTEVDEDSEELPYIFEPTAPEILEALLPHYIEVKLYSALIESHTSEQAARMMAMQNAKNNARDIGEALTLIYNKSRQERITNDILDITNSATT